MSRRAARVVAVVLLALGQRGGWAADPPLPPSPRFSDPLIRSINAARAAAGRPPLQPLPAALAETNGIYLRPLLASMVRTNACDHDLARWEAVQAETLQRGSPLLPTSEVIACPRGSGQWDPAAIVNQWLASPLHANILLNRPRATHIDCLRRDEAGRSMAICTLWSPSGN